MDCCNQDGSGSGGGLRLFGLISSITAFFIGLALFLGALALIIIWGITGSTNGALLIPAIVLFALSCILIFIPALLPGASIIAIAVFSVLLLLLGIAALATYAGLGSRIKCDAWLLALGIVFVSLFLPCLLIPLCCKLCFRRDESCCVETCAQPLMPMPFPAFVSQNFMGPQPICPTSPTHFSPAHHAGPWP